MKRAEKPDEKLQYCKQRANIFSNNAMTTINQLELISYFISKMVKLSTILNAFSIAAVATRTLVLADEGKALHFLERPLP